MIYLIVQCTGYTFRMCILLHVGEHYFLQFFRRAFSASETNNFDLSEKVVSSLKQIKWSYDWILHIWISLGTKFQVKLTILIFWVRFAQGGISRGGPRVRGCGLLCRPFPGSGGGGGFVGCAHYQQLIARSSHFEVYSTGRLQWHFTCGFDFRFQFRFSVLKGLMTKRYFNVSSPSSRRDNKIKRFRRKQWYNS